MNFFALYSELVFKQLLLKLLFLLLAELHIIWPTPAPIFCFLSRGSLFPRGTFADIILLNCGP